jgi:hypothetical protein
MCTSCVFVRQVTGRLGKSYLLCRNEDVPEKYPRQPRLSCDGYQEQDTEHEFA